ncbi:MAG: hypothetical protein FE048_03430 [Thermoplasmata archaeon]|nr:MAG: hypothetical protein FE048_03430 [Thermoplasmata archaeon]
MKAFFITFFVIIGTISFSLTMVQKTSGEGNTLYVAADGTAEYTSIQDAIDNASDGDTIFVFNGTYYENIVINKSINLIGENRDATIIDGSGAGDVVNITADWVNISGFTIQNSNIAWSYAGVKINSTNNTISKCIISNNAHGIYTLFSRNNTISNCTISNNKGGVNSLHSYNLSIINNIISGNDWFGIMINFSSGNIIRGNIIKDSDLGIGLGCNNTIVVDNVILNNTWIGVLQGYASGNNIIYHNNFVNNALQARDAYTNTWDNGYPSGGNYWSDFDEPSEGAWDNDSDGIVDSPYNISGGSNQDRYPLINPLDFIPPFTTCNVTATLGSEGWYVSNVSIELFAIDNESDINLTMYCIDNGEWLEYAEPFNISSDGIHSIKFYSVDICGNKEKTRIKEIKIDRIIPTLSYYLQPSEPDGNDGWYLGNVEVTISANDETSGVSSVLYKIDDGVPKAYTGYFLITTEGSHILFLSATDSAGNMATKNTTIKIDRKPPTISILPLEEYVKGETQIKWNATDSVDNNLNGSISIYLLQDNESIEIASGLNNTGNYEWNTLLFPDFSPCKIKVVAEDDAGNIGFNTSNPFILDNTPPNIDIVQPAEGDVLGGDMLSIFWNASDNIDANLDTIWIEYSDDGGKTWKTIAKNIQNRATGYPHGISDWENGDYVIKINATDDAGNEGIDISGNFTIDREPPTVKINRPKSGYLYINVLEREILPPIPISFVPSPYNTIIVGKITIDISATDEFSEINNVTIFAGNTTAHLLEPPYTYEWNCPLGKQNIKVIAYDRAGNMGSAELKNILCINA